MSNTFHRVHVKCLIFEHNLALLEAPDAAHCFDLLSQLVISFASQTGTWLKLENYPKTNKAQSRPLISLSSDPSQHPENLYRRDHNSTSYPTFSTSVRRRVILSGFFSLRVRFTRKHHFWFDSHMRPTFQDPMPVGRGGQSWLWP